MHDKEYYKKNFKFYKSAYLLKARKVIELEKEVKRLRRIIEKICYN